MYLFHYEAYFHVFDTFHASYLDASKEILCYPAKLVSKIVQVLVLKISIQLWR